MLKSLRSRYSCRSSALSVYAFISAQKDNELDLNAPYQRDYVWTAKEQQSLLESFLRGLPIQSITIVSSNNADTHMTVVDGKQRLTTLLMFFENKIPYIHNGTPVFAKDMEQADIRLLKKQTVPVSELYNHDGSDVSLADQIDFFVRVNFYGVPQSSEHLDQILNLKKALSSEA